jgi:predicted  nucleic acid-binding Zn-ribbon protein
MAHECDDCGETFETLSRLRLHECTDIGSALQGGDSVEAAGLTDEIDDHLDRVDAGDTTAVHNAVAAFETALSEAVDVDDIGETYRDVFWPYYERVAGALDDATQSVDWTLLGDVVAAYDLTVEDDVPLATPAVANAVGRHVIRTRVTDGVEAIPVAALTYLDDVAVTADDTEDVVREETHAYGWGIGHPDHAVVDRLHDRASDDVLLVNPALEHAFYADQDAAVDTLERLVLHDPIEGTLSWGLGDDIPYTRYLLDCVYGLGTDDHWPTTPRYWNWHDELDYAFELDAAVEQRVRELVADAGFVSEVSDEWRLRDLGL